MHGADVVGGDRSASAHCWYGTMDTASVSGSVLTHFGGDDDVSPSTRASDVTVLLPAPRLSHGAEHELQSLDGSHASVAHGCVLHTD